MKIRIIKKKDEFSLEYKLGDEFSVESKWYGGVNVRSNTGIPLSLDQDEYEIIEDDKNHEKEYSINESRKVETEKNLKVLMLNGSSNKNGCTYTALNEIGKSLNEEGIDYEIFQIGSEPLRDCIGCGKCNEQGCIFADNKVNEFIEKAKKADGFIFGTPVYYAHPGGRILSFLDRAFYSSKSTFSHKPAAAIASARRAGTSASLDVLNKYFGISSMPTVGSTYWNMVHGNNPEDVLKDAEGLQTMRNIGKNMAWMIKCFDEGRKNGVQLPDEEKGERTNFIK